MCGTAIALSKATIVCVLVRTTRVAEVTGPEAGTARIGVFGTDLGIPVEHEGRLYLFFGDQFGSRKRALRDADPIAFTDATELDERGLPLAWVTARTAFGLGRETFRRLAVKGLPPLDYFETPVGGFSHAGRLHVFVVRGFDRPLTYLASSARADADFDLHYLVSTHEDAPRGGKLALVAPVVRHGELFLWGQGTFPDTSVYLARASLGAPFPVVDRLPAPRMPLAYYDATTRTWSEREADATPLFTPSEPLPPTLLQVVYLEPLARWAMLYTRATLTDFTKPIVLRLTGDDPLEWSDSEEVVLFDPERDGALGKWMHDPRTSDGLHRVEPVKSLTEAGFAYAPQLLERFTRWDAARRTLVVYWLVSTNVPYQVTLMRSELTA
jgi:hypothetical protein